MRPRTSTFRYIYPSLTAIAFVLAFANGAQAGEDFYLLMFGAQRVPNNPNYAHTFATFVRVCWAGDGPCPSNGATVEAHTISWLPQNMIVRTNALFSECGRNFDLHTTIRSALCNDMRVSLWGPYRIDPELYGRALRQIALLESGQIRYKADDVGRSNDRVSNCIHAVSALSDGYRLRVGSPAWGEPASYFVLRELLPWTDRAGGPHPSVGAALQLEQYPIIYRDWENPRSGTYGGAIFRLFGGERGLTPTYGPPR